VWATRHLDDSYMRVTERGNTRRSNLAGQEAIAVEQVHVVPRPWRVRLLDTEPCALSTSVVLSSMSRRVDEKSFDLRAQRGAGWT
jgi:hypothetical protein